MIFNSLIKSHFPCKTISVFLICILIHSTTQSQRKLSSKENSQKHIVINKIQGYQKKADSLFKIKEIQQAIKCYDSAYQIAKESKNDSLIIKIGNMYANFLCWEVDEPEKALKVCKTVQQFCNPNIHKKTLIKSHLLEAHILTYSENDYSEALDAYSKTISLFDESIPNSLKIKSYRKRGSLLGKINLVEAARKDYKKALSFIEPQKNHRQKIALFYGISTTIDKKDLDSFLYYYNDIKDYCNKDDPKFWACPLNYKNMSIFYTFHNNPEKAKKIIEQHIDTNKEYSKVFYSSYSCLHTLGSIYMGLKKYDLAIETLQLAKEYAAKAKNFARVSHILKDLSEAYEKNGDLKSSLVTSRMLTTQMDTLNVGKIKKEVAKLEIQRKLKEKEEELIALNKEKETVTLRMSKAQFRSYLLGVLLIIGLFIFINRASSNKVKLHKLNEKVNHNRLLSLQSVMNPHFLFNTFGTLQHFILKKEVKKANSYMTTLSELIRNVFSSSNSIYIHFNNEIKILKSYVALELERFDHSFEVTFEIPPQLSKDDPLIPSMMIQPYVENAIIHGFSEKKGDKKLTIKFDKIAAKNIACMVIDNGVGRKKVGEIQQRSKVKKNLSIATKNTQERLRIINKKNELEGNIVIQDLYDTEGEPSGTKAIVSLPIINPKNN